MENKAGGTRGRLRLERSRNAWQAVTYNLNMVRKKSAAVSLGRKGGMKGGPARAAKLTPEQRSGSSRKKLGGRKQIQKTTFTTTFDTSDNALAALLERLKAAVDPNEIRRLSGQIERVVFHKQFTSA